MKRYCTEELGSDSKSSVPSRFSPSDLARLVETNIDTHGSASATLTYLNHPQSRRRHPSAGDR